MGGTRDLMASPRRLLVLSALVAPTRAYGLGHQAAAFARRSAPGPPRSLVVASSDDDRAAVEGDLLAKIDALRRAGESDEEILSRPELQSLASKQVELQGGDASAVAPVAPTSGEAEWGRWRQSADSVGLEVFLPADVKTKDVLCEAAEGWLCVSIDSSYGMCYEDDGGAWGGEETVEGEDRPPLLLGRFAQAVVGSELMWAVDEEADGRRVLCVELPKAPRNARDKASVDCIFDETLLVGGQPCLVPGLSQGTLTLQMPK